MVEFANDFYVSQHKLLRVSRSRKSNCQLLADRAVRPVAAQKPLGADLLDAPSAAQPGRNARIVLCQPDQLGVALDLDSEFCDALL
jgi:hypothetical protein